MDKALELAEKFHTSENPAYVDTLGWVYYKQGNLDSAMPLLLGALEKVPELPVFNYHVGMAYYSKGDLTSARQHLEKSVEADQDFLGVDEAKRTLATL
jgi:tetratricopeptide (TPR) repeat protein